MFRVFLPLRRCVLRGAPVFGHARVQLRLQGVQRRTDTQEQPAGGRRKDRKTLTSLRPPTHTPTNNSRSLAVI